MIEGGEDEKRQILTDFIQKMDPQDKVMVFVGRKARADDISSDLSLIGEREIFWPDCHLHCAVLMQPI